MKFEDWKVFQNYLSKEGSIFSFDLKSGYHHVDIYPPHQTFLGFSWVVDGVQKYFCFTVLPFGLSSSPYIFTKLLRPLVKFWRFNGVMIVGYIDDGIAISNDYETALTQSKFVRQTLLKAGFVPNIEKSNWLPSFLAEWLGIQVDTYTSLLFIPLRRIESLLKSLDSIFTTFPHTSARKLASVTGKVISMQPVLGNITRLMTRHLYDTIESRVSWDQELNLSDCDSAVKNCIFGKKMLKVLIVKSFSSSQYQVSSHIPMQVKQDVAHCCQ